MSELLQEILREEVEATPRDEAPKKKARRMAPVDEKIFQNIDHSFIAKLEPFLKGLWDHYFRCEVEGLEKVPEHKALFVGNHNGLLTFEVLMLQYAWRMRFGDAKKALGLAHSVILENPFFKWILPRLGAIPASPEIADEAMRRGFSLLVYPGGEKESFRPYSERDKIDFFGRKGFIKLALRNKVPIVPIVSIGAHESYVILDRGELLADALGVRKKLRLHGLPLTYRSIFFLWCLASGVFTFFPLLIAPWALLAVFVPLPAKMKFKVLDEIDVVSMVDPALSEDENLEKIYQRVLSTMQETLTSEYQKRKLPIFG